MGCCVLRRRPSEDLGGDELVAKGDHVKGNALADGGWGQRFTARGRAWSWWNWLRRCGGVWKEPVVELDERALLACPFVRLIGSRFVDYAYCKLKFDKDSKIHKVIFEVLGKRRGGSEPVYSSRTDAS